MSPIREQLVGVIDCLLETEQSLLLEIARRLLPDDIAVPGDLEASQEAQAEYARGRQSPMRLSTGIKAKGRGSLPRPFVFVWTFQFHYTARKTVFFISTINDCLTLEQRIQVGYLQPNRQPVALVSVQVIGIHQLISDVNIGYRFDLLFLCHQFHPPFLGVAYNILARKTISDYLFSVCCKFGNYFPVFCNENILFL